MRSWVRVAAATVAISLTAVGTSPGAVSAAPAPVVIAVLGDFGSGAPAERQVARIVAAARPTDIVTTGDNVYSAAGYAALVGAYYPTWVAARRVFPATGNHDYAEGITAFDSYFSWLHGQRTYTRAMGQVAFFVLDSQAALDSPAERERQRAWLQRSLAASPARWRVVVLHHPPYSSGTVHGSTAALQWPYRAWGADLVLSGHEHNYERLDKGGVTYVVDGSGGQDLYRLGSPLGGSLARDDTDYGVLLLRPGDHALGAQFLTAAGRVVDRFSIPGRTRG